MEQNPWQSEAGQDRNPYSTQNTSTTQGQQSHQSQYQPPQHSYQSTQQDYQPPQQQHQQSQWQDTPQDWANQDPTDNPWGSTPGQTQSYQPPSHSYSQPQSQAYGQQPTPGLRRSETDDLLEAEPDRAEQVEHMQQYEASKPQSEDDRNQESLQRQFPSIDSSLIAAIYNDYKQGAGRVDMAQIREMLQELQS